MHLNHAIENDCITKANIISNDTDIIILAMSLFSQLKQKGLHELWISFGTSKKKRWFPIHSMVEKFGFLKSQGLLFFHAFSGCDNISGFRGKGKKAFFQTWNVFPNVTKTFIKLSTFPVTLEEKDLTILENFIVYLYDKSASSQSINVTRKKLLLKRIPSMTCYLQQVKP